MKLPFFLALSLLGCSSDPGSESNGGVGNGGTAASHGGTTFFDSGTGTGGTVGSGGTFTAGTGGAGTNGRGGSGGSATVGAGGGGTAGRDAAGGAGGLIPDAAPDVVDSGGVDARDSGPLVGPCNPPSSQGIDCYSGCTPLPAGYSAANGTCDYSQGCSTSSASPTLEVSVSQYAVLLPRAPFSPQPGCATICNNQATTQFRIKVGPGRCAKFTATPGRKFARNVAACSAMSSLPACVVAAEGETIFVPAAGGTAAGYVLIETSSMAGCALSCT